MAIVVRSYTPHPQRAQRYFTFADQFRISVNTGGSVRAYAMNRVASDDTASERAEGLNGGLETTTRGFDGAGASPGVMVTAMIAPSGAR